ncbi:MAG: ThiF family adenylyltransferase [bacterium]|nr:ThiF family adenylyltransferase [bacterium]
MTNRYDRQEQIQGWQQDKLAQAHVLLAGAGALGNEALKNLALLGVGHILVVDFDRIELSNLSRTVLFRPADIDRPKARIAAERAARLNPDIDIRWIDGNLFYDLGLGFYRHADLVIGGLDNLAARSHVGLNCALADVPFLDGGMWALGGEVRWFVSGEGACFECTLSDDDRQRAYERRSCSGFRIEDEQPFARRMPSTISTTAVIGGLMAQETVRYLCGRPIAAGEAIVYNGLQQSMHKSKLPRDPHCPYHTPYQNVIGHQSGVADTTPRELLELAQKALRSPAILELGRDLLLEFKCETCRQHETVEKLLAQVAEPERLCPRCGKSRKANILTRLDGSELQAGWPLNALSVPPGEVLAVRVGEDVQLYELTGDVETFWNSPPGFEKRGGGKRTSPQYC